MMKSMLFGLLISGKLVTCQYMLSEIRSRYSFASANFACIVADLQCFLRSGFPSMCRRGLPDMIANCGQYRSSIEPIQFEIQSCCHLLHSYCQQSYSSIESLQLSRFRVAASHNIVVAKFIFATSIPMTNIQGLCLSIHLRSVNLQFLPVPQPSFDDETHTTFAVFTRVPIEPNLG